MTVYTRSSATAEKQRVSCARIPIIMIIIICKNAANYLLTDCVNPAFFAPIVEAPAWLW